MKAAVALMELTEVSNTVYRSAGSDRFHEDPECPAMRAGHMIWMCLCGDPYCGCKTDEPPAAKGVTIAEAAVTDMTPCAVCYPGFQELAVQLPADDDFGHRPVDEYVDGPAGVSQIVCQRCVTWTPFASIEDGEGLSVYVLGRRVGWPCMSAQVLNLAPRQEEKVS